MDEKPYYIDLATKHKDRGGLRVWMVVILFFLLGFVGLIGWRIALFGHASPLFIALIVFSWINIVITAWEIALHLEIDLIERQYAHYAENYHGREFDRVVDLFKSPIRVGEIFSTRTWAEIWSTYALFDDAYANKRSFGFWIDTGNGFFTLLPSLFVVYGLTTQAFSARVMGMVSLVLFWQVFYGTLIYFMAYIHSKQHKKHSLGHLLLLVGCTNGVWFTLPVIGMVVSVTMILSGTYDVLG